MNQKQLRTIIDAAKRARRRSYSPYSRFPIGAAVLSESGRVFTGANVENASYGLTICAERVAVFNAVTHGEKGFRAVCVVGRSARPCGACRQVMLEFSTKETEIVCVDLGDDDRGEHIFRTKMTKMLPNAFDPLDAGLLPANPQNLLKGRRGKRASAKKRRNKRPAPKKRGAKRAAPKKRIQPRKDRRR